AHGGDRGQRAGLPAGAVQVRDPARAPGASGGVGEQDRVERSRPQRLSTAVDAHRRERRTFILWKVRHCSVSDVARLATAASRVRHFPPRTLLAPRSAGARNPGGVTMKIVILVLVGLL